MPVIVAKLLQASLEQAPLENIRKSIFIMIRVRLLKRNPI